MCEPKNRPDDVSQHGAPILVAITDRTLCREPLPRRVAALVAAGCDAVILREKDLPPAAYLDLATQVADALARKHLPRSRLILHGVAGIAAAPALDLRLHLPLAVLRAEKPTLCRLPQHLGASVHSAAEAREAQELGASYVVAGHIYATACKPGVPPRGVAFLQEVVAAVSLPVWAVGGMSLQTASVAINAGACGICVRGAAMDTPLEELDAWAACLRTEMRRRAPALHAECTSPCAPCTNGHEV